MSVVRCKQCQTLVAGDAKVCPTCGKKMSTTSTMVKVLSVAFACVVLTTCYSVMSGKAPQPAAPIAQVQPDERVEVTEDQARYAERLKGGAEPTVKDAMWMTGQNLYIGMIDDKSDRSGFAEYICADAVEHKARAEMVKVVDIATVARDGKFREIGKATCK